jgi:hypothetical protein
MLNTLSPHTLIGKLRGAPVGSLGYKLVSTYRVARFGLLLGPWRDTAIQSIRRVRKFPTCGTSDVDIFPGLDVDVISSLMQRDGYALGPSLPEKYLAAILRYCAQSPPSHLHAHRRCPEIAAIATSAKVVEIVRRYLGVTPILYKTAVINTQPQPIDDGERKWRFHYDVGDFRAMTLWIYLSDVDADSGPHAVIRGTHRRDTLSMIATEMLPVPEASARYGERVHNIIGEKGSSIFEDQVIYHRQAECRKPRTILGISYVAARTPL